MRRARRVTIMVSDSFYNKLDSERKKFQLKIGTTKNMPMTSYTEILARRGIKFPDLGINILGGKNVKRKKSRDY